MSRVPQISIPGALLHTPDLPPEHPESQDGERPHEEHGAAGRVEDGGGGQLGGGPVGQVGGGGEQTVPDHQGQDGC